MKITSTQLRQLIREELLHEAWDSTPHVSFVMLRNLAERFVFDRLLARSTAELGRAPKGEALKGLRREAEMGVKEMFEAGDEGRTSLLLGSQAEFDEFLADLLSFSSRRGDVVKLKVSAVQQEDLQDPKRILVHNCPGWPTELTGRDLYKIGSLLAQNPRMATLREQYKEAFDLGDDPGSVLSRGVIFMIIDLILSSAPKGNSVYYVPEPELSITVFKPAFEVPKGVTMAALERGA